MQVSEMPESTRLIAEAFRGALNTALSNSSTSQWQVKAADELSSEKPDSSATVGYRFTFSGASSGDVIVGVYYSMLGRFRFRDLDDDTTAQKNQLLSALQGRVSLLEESLSKAGAVAIKVELVDNPVLGDHQVLQLNCRPESEGEEAGVAVHLCMSTKLLVDLKPAAASPFVFPQAAEAAANLDLVMDVELNVTLRFGQRQLALREVLELTSGSVVELDRQVDEPIELILDGRVVARGEAVIIDGNYGMRVTQVLQPFIA
ncbi:flagellar motor switch protein FliN/FliY [Granulicella aggregans]|uniref:Flagellar motor switch protein FliN n=1 Tax=Granulicella aggregans TaxID=474949 RepID=A0A7W7ZAW0_9BACT|nr:flagellar motor switch protein FliN [Granulicella aggregans]MBB5056382.1 flagellar motor switch protein FliN/FliY [Granulicella aggregans]